MTDLPATVAVDGIDWHLREIDGHPIYSCADPLVDFETMRPVLVVGSANFHPTYDSRIGYHFAFVKPPRLEAALQLLQARTRIFASNRAQNHLLKLLAETDDEETAGAALHAIFLIERDREAKRRREKEARKVLYDLYRNLDDININRARESEITDEELVIFQQFNGKIVDEFCKKTPGRDEKRRAVEKFEMERRRRERRAFELLSQAGYAGGIEIVEPLPEESKRSVKGTKNRL